jgi:hypothetical protein
MAERIRMTVVRSKVTAEDKERLAREWQEMHIALGKAVNGSFGLERKRLSLLATH